jgi:hypothetical protein
MMSHLCNRCVRELLILARTWSAFGLPSKTGCDTLTLISLQKLVIPTKPMFYHTLYLAENCVLF